MRIPTPLSRAACACLLGMSLSAHAQTQTQSQTQGDSLVEPVAARQQAREIAQGDPARWTREDTTIRAKLRTVQKEMGAALQEAKNACKRAPAAERSACVKQAQAVYQSDMAQAKAHIVEQGQTP